LRDLTVFVGCPLSCNHATFSSRKHSSTALVLELARKFELIQAGFHGQATANRISVSPSAFWASVYRSTTQVTNKITLWTLVNLIFRNMLTVFAIAINAHYESTNIYKTYETLTIKVLKDFKPQFWNLLFYVYWFTFSWYGYYFLITCPKSSFFAEIRVESIFWKFVFRIMKQGQHISRYRYTFKIIYNISANLTEFCGLLYLYFKA